MISTKPSKKRINLIIATFLFALFHQQATQPAAPPALLDKMRVSAALFRGRISTVIPHPIQPSTQIVRIKVTKFLKGCGDSTVNLYIQNGLPDISAFNQPVSSAPYAQKPEILVFACGRDENGIGWDPSAGLGGESVIEWDFGKFYPFENEVENELGCLGCCSSGGVCGASLEEAERRSRVEKSRRQQNNQSEDKQRIGELLGEFGLKSNKEGVSAFFGSR